VKIILFDIDGTLLRGHGAGSRAMLAAGRQICGAAFALEGVMISGGLDPVIYAEAARIMGLADAHTLHDAFRDCYLLELERELVRGERRCELLPGVTSLLEMLAQRDDVAVGLLTGNYQRAVPIKFAAVNLQHHFFVSGAFGDDAPTRPGLVPVARSRMASALARDVPAEDVIIVGDTPRDVDCALQHGCRCLAVETGYFSRADLLSAGATQVVRDLSDPAPLLAML
jgi:phosphoglycolate phosphatase